MYFAFFILLSVFLHGKQTDGLYICLASYVISVRRTKSLLTASFRFYLTIDTLAVQLYTSLSPRRVRDFHPLERAHGAQTKISPAIAWLTIQKFIIFYCPLDGEHTILSMGVLNSHYSFTPPSVTPAIMYLDKSRYTIMIGTIATVIIM